MKHKIISLVFLAVSINPAFADKPVVTDVQATKAQTGSWKFSVTLKHADTGWDHYANAWQVVDAEGTVLAERVLYHPHVNEQPFTRSLSDITLPEDLQEVYVVGQDLVHGLGEAYGPISLVD